MNLVVAANGAKAPLTFVTNVMQIAGPADNGERIGSSTFLVCGVLIASVPIILTNAAIAGLNV